LRSGATRSTRDSLSSIRRSALQPEQQEQAKLWEEIGHANALKFDGESFREAIEQAIELGGASAERYTELALQTARRSGMWKRMPDRTLAESWLDRAFELAQPGTPTYSRALAAAALWRKDETAALELHAITEDAGDPDLRSSALAALADVAWSEGDVDRVRRFVEERLSLLPDLSDPDDRHFALMSGVNINLETGRLSQARELSLRLQEMVAGLTPHHRLHGVAVRIDVEAWAGYWETVRELTPSVEQVVEANKATPCPANATSLLYCAAAHVGVSRDEVQRLEAQADAHRLEGFESHHQMGDLRLALARSDSGALRRLVDSLDTRVFASIRRDPAAYLDALLVLGEDERIEAEAPELARPGTYVEPFALRALGLVRRDSDAIRQAVARFEAMGLDRHAAETSELARGRGREGERKEP